MPQLSLTSRRTITLSCGLLASLSAGTNYAFSAYSPQLAERLQISSTALNIIGLAGNLGMYLSSPIAGRIIDRIGPTLPLLFASAFLAGGYGLLWYIYTRDDILSFGVHAAALACLMTGTGSSIALSSSASGVARSFGPSVRATVIGSTLAGFGLSAFFWTTVSRLITKGNTTGLLGVFAIGPTLFALIGAAGCRPVSDPIDQQIVDQNQLDQSHPGDSTEDETSRLLPSGSSSKLELSGWCLAKEKDFWIVWSVMGACCGTTLMFINNVGTIVETLYEYPHENQMKKDMRAHQAQAVSILSMFNCLGRPFAGGVSDAMEARFGLRRVWWLTWLSSLFFISQVIGFSSLSELNEVPFLSALIGFAYGNIYGTAPALVLEWFGIKNFATNFGYLNLAPMIAGQLFNLSFGRIYDSHGTRTSNGKIICRDGKVCYESAFKITTVACLLALLLSVYLALTTFHPKLVRLQVSENETGNEDEPVSA